MAYTGALEQALRIATKMAAAKITAAAKLH
jgi:hypothetical protein